MTEQPDTGRDEVPVDVITSAGPASLAEAAERRRRYAELTFESRDLVSKANGLKRELGELEERIKDDFAELGTDSMRTVLDDRGFTASVHLAPDFYARPHRNGIDERSGEPKATDEDWALAVDALKKGGLAEYVQERFHIGALSSWLKGFREEHGIGWRDSLPPGLEDALDLGENMRVRVRKG